jgi:RNA recognition motif-containing protein
MCDLEEKVQNICCGSSSFSLDSSDECKTTCNRPSTFSTASSDDEASHHSSEVFASMNSLAEVQTKKRRSSGSKKLTQYVRKNTTGPSEFTTVIIRNIPTRYTTPWLIEEIQATGNRCNFVHMPMARKIDINLGYAFVNFVTPEEAKAFLAAFEGHQFGRQPRSSKRAAVDFASLQGFEQNVEFYSGRRVAKSKHAPWILRD